MLVTKDCAVLQDIEGLNKKGGVSVPAGGEKTFTVVMLNTGEAMWGSGIATQLGLVGDGGSSCYGYLQTNRWHLDATVSPGEVGGYDVRVSGLDPGQEIRCEFQMVRDVSGPGTGPHWFGDIFALKITGMEMITQVVHAAP